MNNFRKCVVASTLVVSALFSGVSSCCMYRPTAYDPNNPLDVSDFRFDTPAGRAAEPPAVAAPAGGPGSWLISRSATPANANAIEGVRNFYNSLLRHVDIFPGAKPGVVVTANNGFMVAPMATLLGLAYANADNSAAGANIFLAATALGLVAGGAVAASPLRAHLAAAAGILAGAVDNAKEYGLLVDFIINNKATMKNFLSTKRAANVNDPLWGTAAFGALTAFGQAAANGNVTGNDVNFVISLMGLLTLYAESGSGDIPAVAYAAANTGAGLGWSKKSVTAFGILLGCI
ncbi:MAG: hypothetical protein LBB21_00800 [Holosporaceae bacterium]|jgi:hypothetical protein|nr:hypothetical protein [Holosporaceae bacterium]